MLWTLGFAGLVGCGTTLPAGTAADRQALRELAYPGMTPPFDGALDVVVERDGEMLTLQNREARRLENAVLWLNQGYAGFLETLPIGRPVRLPLQRFVNRHGETFPTGRFFAPDLAETLLAAELLTPEGQRYRLTVLPDERWYE